MKYRVFIVIMLSILFIGVVLFLWPKVCYEKNESSILTNKSCDCFGLRLKDSIYKLDYSSRITKHVCLGVLYNCGQRTPEEKRILESQTRKKAFVESQLINIVSGEAYHPYYGGYVTNGVDIGWCIFLNDEFCTVLESADSSSFEVLEDRLGYAKDKNNVYRGAQVLEGEDPSLFVLPNN